MQCTLTESNAEILLLMPNILEWGYDKINLFELHIKSDTVIINYTTTEGKQRDFLSSTYKCNFLGADNKQ